jgi:RNA polymerase sigma-70 factor (ECF subfamily)
VRHQLDLYELLAFEVKERRLACLVVMHDLNIAAQFADRVVLMKGGRVVAAGGVPDVMTWLFRILTNTFINKYRRGGLERSVLEGPDADPLVDGWVSASTMRQLRDPEQAALMPIVEGEVQRALDALPTEFKIAVILCDVEEFSYEEIAQIMGCPIGTVMSRLHRGRKLLQRSLYNHALALGIVKGEPAGETNQTKGQAPTDLNAYRAKRRASA